MMNCMQIQAGFEVFTSKHNNQQNSSDKILTNMQPRGTEIHRIKGTVRTKNSGI